MCEKLLVISVFLGRNLNAQQINLAARQHYGCVWVCVVKTPQICYRGCCSVLTRNLKPWLSTQAHKDPRIQPGFQLPSNFPLVTSLVGEKTLGGLWALTDWVDDRLRRPYSLRRRLVYVPVVIWLKGPVLVQAQILGLLVGELCEMCVERWEM